LRGWHFISFPESSVRCRCIQDNDKRTEYNKRKKRIAAVYPQNDFLTDILSFIGLKAHKLQNEEMMHVFPVGVYLPAAILIANKRGLNLELESAVEVIKKNILVLGTFYLG
jgi:hypothetical protein